MKAAPTATVLIPSHDHGPLLEIAVSTALEQTVDALEVFVVLDGADEATREAARSLTDARVRVFDFPKGERHGEAHRHRVLDGARGRVVCYLADDDLWLPHHVEYMCTLLEDSDLAAAVALFEMGGWWRTIPGDVGSLVFRQRLLADPPFNFVGLSQGAHTLESYRRLPEGWRPAPGGVPTDLHMWRQFLTDQGVRAVSGEEITVLTFPSPRRKSMSVDERRHEMESHRAIVADSRSTNALLAGVVGAVHHQGTAEAGRRLALEATQAELETRVAGLEQDREEWEATTRDLETASARADELESELARIRSSLSYRAARRLAAVPGLGRIGRGMARVLLGIRWPWRNRGQGMR